MGENVLLFFRYFPFFNFPESKAQFYFIHNWNWLLEKYTPGWSLSEFEYPVCRQTSSRMRSWEVNGGTDLRQLRRCQKHSAVLGCIVPPRRKTPRVRFFCGVCIAVYRGYEIKHVVGWIWTGSTFKGKVLEFLLQMLGLSRSGLYQPSSPSFPPN